MIGPLRCPACARWVRADAVGVVSLACEGSRCRKRWEAVRLPPGTTGVQLVALYGLDVARALYGALAAHAASDAVLRAWVIPIPSQAAYYVQRLPDVPEQSIGWHRASSILRALLGAA